MKQTLISICPNCGFDASKHNKILYDRIFLICYNCNYGWYYNIEILHPNNTIHFANKSTPANTLDSSYHKNNAPHYKHDYKLNKNSRNFNTTSINNKYTSKQNRETIPNNKVNALANHKGNISNFHLNYYKHLSEKKHSKYREKSNYSYNIYYEADTLNNTYTKKQSYNIHPLKTKYRKSSINLDKPINLDNTLSSSSLNKKSNTLKNKSTSFNKALNTIGTNYFTNNRTKFIKINNLNNNSNIKINPKIVNFQGLEKTKNYIPIKKTIPTNHITRNYVDLNKNNVANNIKIYDNSKNIEKISNTNNKIKNKILNADQYHNSNSLVPLSSKLNKKEPIDNTINASSSLNYPNNFQEISSQKISKENFDAFNTTSLRNNYRKIENDLNNKSNLGLNNINLLKFEQQANYNLEQFKVPLINITQIIKSFLDFIKEIIYNICKIPKLIFKIFTRLDLFLKTFAYLFILTGTISFLSYSYYKKQNIITFANLKNTECNNKSLLESNKQLTFQNDNYSISNNTDSNIIKNHSLAKEKIKVVDEKPEEKIIAFEKQSKLDTFGKESKTYKNNSINNATNQHNEELSFFTKIKAIINNSLFSIKQTQINTFNKVKIYNDGFSLQGEYNNTLSTYVILSNDDRNNSYLIKSLEVIFLEKSGTNIVKRIIITNQFVNAKSAVSINLKINNPPKNTNKIVIFIKDKKKL